MLYIIFKVVVVLFLVGVNVGGLYFAAKMLDGGKVIKSQDDFDFYE